MARVIPNPSIQQLSGATHRGSQTILFPRGRHTFARIRRGTPWRNTTAQVRVTQLNKNATSAFGSLTDSQRATWKVYASNFFNVHMGVVCPNTDLEMFIATNFIRQLNQDPIATIAPLTPAEPFDFTLLETFFFNHGPGLAMKFSHAATDFDNSWLLIRASHSFPSPARKARKCDYRLCGSMEHYSIFPLQPSPQFCYIPLTPLAHIDNHHIWIACTLISSDYYRNIQVARQSQIEWRDALWYTPPDHEIIFNAVQGSLDFKISNTLVAQLFQNGNLHLKGEVLECTPAQATPSYNYIHFDNATTQIRLAFKTKETPGFKTFLSLGPTGDCTTFGEIYEFQNLSAHSELLHFHSYLDPRKVQLSVDRQIPSLIFFVDDAPQNSISLREVTEHAF